MLFVSIFSTDDVCLLNFQTMFPAMVKHVHRQFENMFKIIGAMDVGLKGVLRVVKQCTSIPACKVQIVTDTSGISLSTYSTI